MKYVISLSCVLALSATAPLWADDVPQPLKMSKDQIAGKMFEDHVPVTSMHDDSDWGPYETKDVETYLSPDRKFDTGMYRSGPVRLVIDEPYGVDEFMYFIEGGVTLTSKDGTVTEIGAGEAVTIPHDWMGVWESRGYMKIYVIYSPEAPIG